MDTFKYFKWCSLKENISLHDFNFKSQFQDFKISRFQNLDLKKKIFILLGVYPTNSIMLSLLMRLLIYLGTSSARNTQVNFIEKSSGNCMGKSLTTEFNSQALEKSSHGKKNSARDKTTTLRNYTTRN
ncbi:hypothetical protein U3516DRAFT_734778 [Neocallimastix sp. 'constans']